MVSTLWRSFADRTEDAWDSFLVWPLRFVLMVGVRLIELLLLLPLLLLGASGDDRAIGAGCGATGNCCCCCDGGGATLVGEGLVAAEAGERKELDLVIVGTRNEVLVRFMLVYVRVSPSTEVCVFFRINNCGCQRNRTRT